MSNVRWRFRRDCCGDVPAAESLSGEKEGLSALGSVVLLL